MLKKFSSGLLAVLLLCSPITLRANQEQNNDFYRQLLPYFINSQEEQEKPQAITAISSSSPTQKTKIVDVTLRKMEPNEYTQMTLELLNHVKPLPHISQSAIDPLKKFNIIAPGTPDMVTMLMPRSTIWGKCAFAHDCTKPFSYHELLQRQSITRFFAKNSDALKKASDAFELIERGQRGYLAYFEQIDDTSKQALDSLYFSNMILKPFNTSKVMLAISEAGRWLQLSIMPAVYSGLAKHLAIHGGSACMNTFLSIMNKEKTVLQKITEGLSSLSVIPQKVMQDTGKDFFYSHCPIAFVESIKKRNEDRMQLVSKLLQDEDDLYEKLMPFTPKSMRDSMIRQHNWQQKVECAQAAAELELQKANPLTTQDRYNITSDQLLAAYGTSNEKLIKAGSALVTYGPVVLWDVLLFLALKKSAAEIAQTNSIYKNYQTRLQGVAKIVRGLTIIAGIARNTDNAAISELAEDIELFLDASKNSDLSALLDALETDTFTGHTSFFSNRPRILATNKLMERCKDLFVRPLAAAGKLEVFVTATKFYTQHAAQESATPVCFVDFVNDAEPRIEFENCWNILVPEKDVVCIESLTLGKNGVRNALFTGPNGTGKSTNENAIAGIYFTSKFGIACASRATMTPFEVFEAHRNEQEDLSKGMSTFMAQKARFDDICTRIAHLDDQRMIIFMDEPLSGTVEAEAGRIIYENCKQLLTEQKQAICIIATHAEQPTKLENDTHGAFKNFHVEVLETEPGIFMRTYRLLPGILNNWFDNPEWRHRFVQWLSEKR